MDRLERLLTQIESRKRRYGERSPLCQDDFEFLEDARLAARGELDANEGYQRFIRLARAMDLR